MKNAKNRFLYALCFLCMSGVTARAQGVLTELKKSIGVEISYQSVYKGKVYPGTVRMTVVGNRVSVENVPLVSAERQEDGSLAGKRVVQKSFIDYDSCEVRRLALLPNGNKVYTSSSFELGSGLIEQGIGKHLGVSCRIVRASVNSNTIDIWYVENIPFRGTPQAAVGVPDGLVLKVVRNGDMIQEATSILPLKKAQDVFPESWGEWTDTADFQYAVNHSGVITIPVFDQQTVCFNGAKLPDELKEDVVYSAGGGSIILKKVILPESARRHSVFAEVVQYSDGDAYDRTGSVFVVPIGKEQSFIDAMRCLDGVPFFRSGDTDYHGLVSTAQYDAPLELMRFFTGFGVRKFNYNKVKGQVWVDSVLYKTEVTPLSQWLEGETWIGAYIGNWDAKGHRLSLKLKYYPERESKPLHAIPLFNTVNYLEQAGQPYPIFMRGDSLKVKFYLDKPVQNARLYYLTTGHGGWGGGDEFNQKTNTIYLDGKKVITFVPWRDDCGTYRNWNPCSGNFSNGLSSSDLSRSNWCPGTVTTPEYIYLGNLDSGEHTITVAIPQGAPESGSNSYWCVSGTLLY